MSRFAPVAPRAVRRGTAPGLVSTLRFNWEGRRGSLVAVTGHVGTLTRASTGTAVDANGVTYTAAHSMARWEARDFANSGRRAQLGLRLGADDFAFPVNWLPETGTLLVHASEAGTRTTSGAGLVYLGNDGQTGARLWVDSDGTNYRANVHNGSTSQSATLSTATPTTDQGFQVGLQLEDDGTNWRVRLVLRVMPTGAETFGAWTTPIARAAAWGTGAKLRANRVGSAGTLGSTWIRRLAWGAGYRTLDELEQRL